MLSALFAAALAVLPPSGDTSWLQLDDAVQLDAGSISAKPNPLAPKVNPPDGRWLGGAGTVGLTLYRSRVRDDDAAPPLQPFLQRVARLHVEGGGSGASIRYPIYVFSPVEPSAFLNLLHMSEQGGRFETDAESYFGRWIHVGASVAVDYARWQYDWYGQTIAGFGNVTPIASGTVSSLASSELTLTSAVAAGVRWRDLLFSAGWGVTAVRLDDKSLGVRFWGGAFVDVRAVLRRSVEVTAHAQLLEGGARGEGAITVWLRRRLGVSVGIEGGHGAFADSPVTFDRAGGHVGASFWLTPGLGATLAYAPAWQQATPVVGLGAAMRDFSLIAHVITLSVHARPLQKAAR